MPAERRAHGTHDLTDRRREDGRVEGRGHVVLREDAEFSTDVRRRLVGRLARRDIGELTTVREFLNDRLGERGGRQGVRCRRGLVEHDDLHGGAGGHLELFLVRPPVRLDVGIAHRELVVGVAAGWIHRHVPHLDGLELIPELLPEVGVGREDARGHLPEQLASRDDVPVVGFEQEELLGRHAQHGVLPGGQVQATRRVRELRTQVVGRIELCRLRDLSIRNGDPAAPQLLKNQQLVDHLIEGSVFDFGVLLGRDHLLLRALDLVIELAVRGHVRLVHHRIPVHGADLAETSSTLTGDVHAPLKHHERHERDRCEQHDRLRCFPHLTHHKTSSPTTASTKKQLGIKPATITGRVLPLNGRTDDARPTDSVRDSTVAGSRPRRPRCALCIFVDTFSTRSVSSRRPPQHLLAPELRRSTCVRVTRSRDPDAPIDVLVGARSRRTGVRSTRRCLPPEGRRAGCAGPADRRDDAPPRLRDGARGRDTPLPRAGHAGGGRALRPAGSGARRGEHLRPLGTRDDPRRSGRDCGGRSDVRGPRGRGSGI